MWEAIRARRAGDGLSLGTTEWRPDNFTSHGPTRAEFLRLMGAAAAWTIVAARHEIEAAPQTRGAPATDDVEGRVARIIAAYDRQGVHRTATDADHASARWLADEARGVGATAALEPFELERVDVQSAFVEAEGRRAEGLPLFDAGFTDAAGVSGVVSAPPAEKAIALVRLNAAGIQSEGRALADLRRSPTRAILAITDGASPGLSPANAASFRTPYGVPVLQVGSEHGTWLDGLARDRRIVRLVAHPTRTRATASNVVATIAGRDQGAPPVVVMTPRSGWWHCAGERGGGLACWLEVARDAAAAPARAGLVLVASSGHELGHLGLEAFLARRPGLIEGARGWIHLGANIGAAGGRPRLQAADDEIEALAASALVRAGVPVEQRVPRGTVPAGEARNIHVANGRYVSLLGTSPVFHSAADRWPAAVDAPAVARFARAMSAVARALADA